MDRRRILRIVIACLLAGAAWAIVEFKYYCVPKRFRVVEAGQIYRGGWQKPGVLRRLIEDHRFAAVLNVACDPAEPDAAGEGPVVRELEVTWHKILMPGTGLATFEQLDEAAEFLADPTHRPIFVHCAAGVHRTNMAIAAYRLKYCNWSLDEALREMKLFGFDPIDDWEQAEHLQAYRDASIGPSAKLPEKSQISKHKSQTDPKSQVPTQRTERIVTRM